MQNKDSGMEKIVNSLKNFKRNIEPYLPLIDKEINETIEVIQKFKVDYTILKNSSELECQIHIASLDNKMESLLDSLNNPYTEKQFHKLLYYWEELNPESAKDYRNYYKELYIDKDKV